VRKFLTSFLAWILYIPKMLRSRYKLGCRKMLSLAFSLSCVGLLRITAMFIMMASAPFCIGSHASIREVWPENCLTPSLCSSIETSNTGKRVFSCFFLFLRSSCNPLR
jgi:hypothetical protein